jgi:hypothetical protein
MLLNSLRQHEPRPVHQQTKSDVFALAISVMEAALLSAVSLEIYNIEQQKINWEVIQKHLG